MNIKIEDIQAVVAKLKSYFDIDVEIDNTMFTVWADGPKAINEFESRLVAAGFEWEDKENELLNGVIFLDELVNFVDHREVFEPLVHNGYTGTWKARYTNLTFTDQD